MFIKNFEIRRWFPIAQLKVNKWKVKSISNTIATDYIQISLFCFFLVGGFESRFAIFIHLTSYYSVDKHLKYGFLLYLFSLYFICSSRLLIKKKTYFLSHLIEDDFFLFHPVKILWRSRPNTISRPNTSEFFTSIASECFISELIMSRGRWLWPILIKLFIFCMRCILHICV